MENESRFCVGFYCGLRSTQRTVVIESIIELTLIITCRMYKVNFFSVLSGLFSFPKIEIFALRPSAVGAISESRLFG